MKKKITFFTKYLPIGGVERQLCYLLKGLNKEKYDISLVLCKKQGEFLKDIPSHIQVSDLSVNFANTRKLIIAIKLFFLLRKRKPDIFISFYIHLNSISVLICSILSIKVFCCFPGYFYKGRLNSIRNFYLKRANMLIAVSDSVLNSIKASIKDIDDKKFITIKNAIDLDKITSLSNDNIDNNLFSNDLPIVASLGRLEDKKGFDVLIKSIPSIKTKCNFVIIGDGSQREKLESLSNKLGLSDRVLFIGNQINPYVYLSKAKLFILASESEGLPTVILEAKTLGIPCICADYRGGTKGIINHGIDGYVFKRNDIKELAYAIDLLLNNIELRKKFSQESLKQVKNEFKIENYIRQYENLFDEN